MVAGLTADVFVQLTATLAQLSLTLNKTKDGGNPFGSNGPVNGKWPVVISSGDISTDESSLPPIPIKEVYSLVGTNASIPCPDSLGELNSAIHSLDWICAGCSHHHNPESQDPDDGSHHSYRHRSHSGEGDDKLVSLAPTVSRRYELTRIASFGPERILRYFEPTRLRVPLPPSSGLMGRHEIQRSKKKNKSDRFYGLYFLPLGVQDEGDYTCIVNGNLRPSMILRLKVQAQSDPPGKPLIMAFTAKSVNLSWTPPLKTHHSPIHHYLIHIRVGEAGSWNANSVLQTETNVTIYQVKHLSPFTTYSFKVSAVNDIGTSEESKESYYTMTLRTKPTGKAVITSAHNTSSTSIRVTWRPPSVSTIHGEFLGYRISYRPRGDPQSNGNVPAEEVYLKDHEVTRYELVGLEVYEQYAISIQVYNPEGLGPPATVLATTDEGVPSMPVEVKALEILNSSITLEWSRPLSPNGIIQGYRLYYMRKNFTDVKTVRQVGPIVRYFLSGLEPFTRYKFWVKAFTWKNEGEPSKAFEIWSDVMGPSAPLLTNLTCRDVNSIFIQWDPPRLVYNRIDTYFVYYQSEDQVQYQIITVNMDTITFKERKILLTNLTSDMVYTIQLRAASNSIYDSEVVYRGKISQPSRLHLRLHCDTVQAFSVLESEDVSGEGGASRDYRTGILAGVGLVVICIIIGVVILIIKKRYSSDSYYYVGDNTASGPSNSHYPPPSRRSRRRRSSSNPGASSETVDTLKDSESLPMLALKPNTPSSASNNSCSSDYALSGNKDEKSTRNLIPREAFLAKCSGHPRALTKEFESILAWEKELWKSLNLEEPPENIGTRTIDRKDNNRYANFISYEHTRVTLEPSGTLTLSKKKSQGQEYLNANFIDGFDGRKKSYIGTQGPTPLTFSLFWRMVWEKNVHVVVMMTNLVESGKKKCDQYWPSTGREAYGPIEVSLVGQEVMSSYTIRSFRVVPCNRKSDHSERLLLQYHYTHWPDHGTPQHPLALLNFVKKSSAANRENDGPIVVHCSAGVGRTGAYIFLDSMLKQLKYKGGLDPIGYLSHIRTQRMHLVQTSEQYIFVHRVLQEAASSGETNVHRSSFSKYVRELSASEALDRQFLLLTHREKANEEQGSLRSRTPKIRRPDFCLEEENRVKLKSSSSDFINASWISGYNRSREFILTQHPTEKTILDFWRMIWDHNVQVVVVVSAIQPPNFGVFWPTSSKPTLDFDSLKVKLISESAPSPGIKLKSLNLLSLNDDFEFGVKFVFCPAWPHVFASAPPLSGVGHLVRFVLKLTGALNTPLAVVDAFGGLEGATFASLTTLLKQLDSEHSLDVYSAGKSVHSQRPGVWKNPNELLFLYKVLEAIIVEPPVYIDSVENIS